MSKNFIRRSFSEGGFSAPQLLLFTDMPPSLKTSAAIGGE
jgi:hypothetical protein